MSAQSIGLGLSLLGSPRLEQNGISLRIGRQKAFALLSYLAVTKQAHRRETLVTLLWPDLQPSLAYSYLRRDLSLLNKVLGRGWLETDRYNIGIADRKDLWLDTLQFQGILKACGDHNHKPDEVCDDCMPLLIDAVALYRGDFLSGFYLPDSSSFEEWQTFEAHSFRSDLVWALQRLIYGLAAQGKFEEALAYARQWLRVDPYHEPAHRKLMQLYAWMGNWSEAERQYDELRKYLETEMQLSPDSETHSLYHLIRERKVEEPPVWHVDEATRYIEPHHNLPSQFTPFFGREQELADIAHGLLDEPTCRMLTLVGPGGIGKTRLALQAATQVLKGFHNGVFLVPLANKDSAEQITPSIADALSLPFHGGAESRVQLINYLREKQLLLILDNFEGLVHNSDLLVEILNNAPDIKLLVTSRERLNLSMEKVHPVFGLTYPEDADELSEDTTSTGAARRYSALDLLLERVHRIYPEISLTPDERVAALRVCRLLQGIPLGLELAATWIKVLSFTELAQEIEHNLDFLTETTRDTPDRHRSLRATFEQSWQHLSEQERKAYQRLSLFRGGFRRKAAEQVFDISLSLLAKLIDKSLIYHTASGRYSMHEFSRQYAEEKLASSTDSVKQLKDDLSAYFASYLEEWDVKSKVGGSLKLLAEIRSEIDNLLSSWRWAVSQGRISDIAKSLQVLHHFYFTVGRVKEGERVFREAALQLKPIVDGDPAPDSLAQLVYSRILSRQARYVYRLGRHRESRDVLDQSLSIFDRMDPERQNDRVQKERAISLFYLSVILRGDGEYEAAERVCQESLDFFEKYEDLEWMAATQKHMGIIAGSQGKYEQAQQWLKSARRQYEAIEDLSGLADTLNDLGNVAIGLGDFHEARRLNQKCLVIRQKTSQLWGIGTSLNNLGYVALVQENFDEARQLLDKSLNIQREIGDLYQIANVLSNLGQAAYGQRNFGAARNYYLEALRYAKKIGAQPLLLEILVGVVTLEIAESSIDANRAAALLTFVYGHPASDQMTKDRASARLADLTKTMPTTRLKITSAIAGALQLEDLVQELLD